MAAVSTRGARFFRDDLESPGLPDLVRSINLYPPPITVEGQYEVSARSGATDLDPAFEILRWRGSGLPTLLFHHGNNERPFDRRLFSKNTFRRVIWEARVEFDANLIVLRAPLHRSLKAYRTGVARLDIFASMIAASVALIEHLRVWSRGHGGGPTIVSGISLGGWVTNLHRACFGSADAYVPLVAGAALDHVFVSSAYRRLATPAALAKPGTLHRVLNFEEAFARVPDANLFPLLARHDQIIDFDRQKQCYRDDRIEVLNKGHVTAAMAAGELRRHLLGVLRRFRTPRRVMAAER